MQKNQHVDQRVIILHFNVNVKKESRHIEGLARGRCHRQSRRGVFLDVV